MSLAFGPPVSELTPPQVTQQDIHDLHFWCQAWPPIAIYKRLQHYWGDSKRALSAKPRNSILHVATSRDLAKLPDNAGLVDFLLVAFSSAAVFQMCVQDFRKALMIALTASAHWRLAQ